MQSRLRIKGGGPRLRNHWLCTGIDASTNYSNYNPYSTTSHPILKPSTWTRNQRSRFHQSNRHIRLLTRILHSSWDFLRILGALKYFEFRLPESKLVRPSLTYLIPIHVGIHILGDHSAILLYCPLRHETESFVLQHITCRLGTLFNLAL